MGKQEIKNIIGVINFNTLCKKNASSFISSRENNWEIHKNKILDKTNISLRLNILIKHSLPNLLNSIHENIELKVVIIYSTLLDSDTVNILKLYESNHKEIILEARSEDDYLDINGSVKRALKKIANSTNNDQILFCSFRLDDDDILSTKYLDLLSKYIQIHNLNKFISFSSGLEVLWENNQIQKMCSYSKNFIAIGLAHIGMFNTKKNSFETTPQTIYCGINHFEIPQRFESIVDTSSNMFIYSRHKNQDTNPKFEFNNIKTVFVDHLILKSFPTISSII